MTKSSIVWVANKNNPISDSSGILTISENGNLVVLDGQKQVVWSTNVSHIASNSSAQLLDSGNLVLADGSSGAYRWQSFLHPSNTLLQGMKLIAYRKTGKKVKITSWKSPSDPSDGIFSCALEIRNVTEIFLREGTRPRWRSGPWNGLDFLGITRVISTNNQNGIRMEEDEDSSRLSFYIYNVIWAYTLVPQGKLERRRWNPQTHTWELLRSLGSSQCDAYGKCGQFGICNSQSSPICSCLRGFEPKNKEEWGRQNWTSGCVRRVALQCERSTNDSQAGKIDGFFMVEKVKVPDDAQVSATYDADAADCQTSCLKNCSCKAYALERNLGCMIWTADLVDIQSFSYGGLDIYIRLAYSELGTGRKKMTTPIIISVLVGTILITASAYFLWKKRSKRKGEMQTHDTRIMALKQVHIPELLLFDYTKLATATSNFDIANKLGQGGFGPVYKGKLEDGKEIAVKRLSKLSRQGMEEFINEVELISGLQHRNLVKLLGCCVEEEQILVYEYMPNKSLDLYIFDLKHQKKFYWGKRFNIIEGIARGLLYLHRDSRLKIIHRDLKASNILLDEEMNPKISDFGMAKLYGGNADHANTERIVGTYGYISPEYATEGLYSEKSDVFSFGVLLLEIISGRKNTSFNEDAESFTLLGLAWKLWMDANITPLIDPHIYDPSFHKDILRCMHIGLLCVQELAKDRPTMASVMSMLQSENMDIPPPSQPAFILRQTMPYTTRQTYDNDEFGSINSLTFSKFEGR
ncbi:G-type lectin S-receptor-like serine/threonine-protein kinase At1g11300 isoform X2 [Neltuma alba]|nr:G-type lectin S-receptor-like serine/threonine-protein kinase At1g11300 isoform X2 [Prosopis alba]